MSPNRQNGAPFLPFFTWATLLLHQDPPLMQGRHYQATLCIPSTPGFPKPGTAPILDQASWSWGLSWTL